MSWHRFKKMFTEQVLHKFNFPCAVVTDKRVDKDADTGMFELAYRQQVSNPQPYMGMNLTVKGNRIARAQGTKPNRQAPKDPSSIDKDLERENASSPVVLEAIK